MHRGSPPIGFVDLEDFFSYIAGFVKKKLSSEKSGTSRLMQRALPAIISSWFILEETIYEDINLGEEWRTRWRGRDDLIDHGSHSMAGTAFGDG
jgi:hypothetical protein